LFFFWCIVSPSFWWNVCFLYYESTFSLKEIIRKNTTKQSYIPRCPDCNIILISLDTLRADHLGCYGYERNTSPNIDKFCKNSIIGKSVYANSYYTLPGHMSIFTSLYPITHKVNFVKSKPLSNNFITLAEILKSAGYRTIWSAPLNHPHLNFDLGFGRGFEEFYNTVFSKREGFKKELFLKILQKNSGRKFFLFIHSFVNHDPYIYPEKFNYKFSNPNYPGNLPKTEKSLFKMILLEMKEDYKNEPDAFFKRLNITTKQKNILKNCFETENASKFLQLTQSVSELQNLIKSEADYSPIFKYFETTYFNQTEEEINELKNRYDNGVFYIDFIFGEFLNLIKRKNLYDNTIIILTSEHGEELFEHGDFIYKNFYDHTIYLPLIIYSPGQKRGIEVNELVQSLDITPTILSLIGEKNTFDLQGHDLLKIIEKNSYIKRKYVFGYSIGDMYIRSKKWKLIKNNDGSDELYYLLRDPLEKNNLIGSKKRIVKKYKKILEIELIKWELRQKG
jgi:arylsulfatase A-like enzyme